MNNPDNPNITTYTFLIRDGEDIDGPVFRVLDSRKSDSDAWAELRTKRLSEDHEGAAIWISRLDARWCVSFGFKPERI